MLKLVLQDVQAGIKKRVEILEFANAECSSKEFKSLLIAESIQQGPRVREAWFRVAIAETMREKKSMP